MPPICEAESPAFAGEGVTARLTQIVRQQADHPILSMTQCIRDAMAGGPVPVFETRLRENGSLIHRDGPAFESALLDRFRSPDYAGDPDQCRVLAWTNARANAYNRLLRRALLGPKADQQALLPGEVVVACSPILEGGVSIGDTVTVLAAVPETHPAQAVPCLRTAIRTETGKIVEVWVVRPEGIGHYRLLLSALAVTTSPCTIRYSDAMPELTRPTQAELDGMSHAGKDALILLWCDLLARHDQRLGAVEGKVGKTGQHSSQPPSSDGL